MHAVFDVTALELPGLEFVVLGLGWQAWLTAGVIVSIVVAMLKDIARPDLIFVGALGLLILTGVLTPEAALAGFASPIVITIGALFVVAAGIQRTQALSFLDSVLLPRTSRSAPVLLRVMSLTSLLSAFMNNTPIVAMLMPRLQQWSERSGVAVSKVLIPLSYAAIVGGMTTLIGASTNIVVSGLLESAGQPGLGMFDLAWAGVPVAITILLYFSFVGHRTLPDYSKDQKTFEDGLRECLFELRVEDRAPWIGRTVEEAGLRSLGDAFLVHVRRGDLVVPATPHEVIRAGDVLTFVGQARALDRLLQYPGLSRVVSPIAETESKSLPLYEAVVAPSSSLVGKTLREVHFREHYGGVVLAIQRQNERLLGPLGRTPIKAGDLLVVEAWNGFDKRWNENRMEFYLVAPRRKERPKPLRKKAPLALLVLAAMVTAFITGVVPLVTAALTAALAMILLRCLRGRDARQAVDLSVLVVIAAALGIGKAAEQTGLAPAAASLLLESTQGFPVIIMLAALYVSTNVLAEFVTSKASAALMIPIAVTLALDLGLDPKPLAIVVAIAASASFITPFGYQTNLMVMGAGGYRFVDYVKAGAPVSILVMLVSLTAVYCVWL